MMVVRVMMVARVMMVDMVMMVAMVMIIMVAMVMEVVVVEAFDRMPSGERNPCHNQYDASDNTDGTQRPQGGSRRPALTGQVGLMLPRLAVEQGRDNGPQHQSKAAWSKATREPPKTVKDPPNLHPLMIFTIQRDLRERRCKSTAGFLHEQLHGLVRHATNSLLRSLRLWLNLSHGS